MPTPVVVKYCPRKWAEAFHESTKRFSVLVMHRRCGKTTCIINHHQRAAMDDNWERARLLALRPGLTPQELEQLVRAPGGRHYGHVMPLRKQGKDTVWDKIKYYAAGIPGVKFNESELIVRYPTGNKFQLFGADDPDKLRGPAFSGLSFDEYSQQPGNIFSEVLSKSLGDHLGYAVFVGTIKGRDHLYMMYQAVKDNPEWFATWQNIDQSLASEKDITIQLLEQAMEDDRKQIAVGLMSEEEYQQEWYLSTDAAIKGQWYAAELRDAKAEGRITNVPYDPALPVDTDWDLGLVDSTAIWFSQSLRSGEVRLIDYYENSGEGLPHYAKVLQQKPYTYGQHWAPHDLEVKELGSGRSRLETALALGLRFRICPNLEIHEGIHAARLLMKRCWFDEKKTARGLECLRHYRKRYNKSLDEFTAEPVHDWACVTGDTEVLTRHGVHQIQYLPEEGEVLTLCGWKPYQHPRVTRRNAPLVAVTFDDGLTVRCTPEHRWLTDSGWKCASDLRMGSRIQSSLIHSSNISTEDSIVSGRRNGISHEVARNCIEKSGDSRLGMSLTTVISTIAMAIHSITTWRIWNACQPLNICRHRHASVNEEWHLQPQLALVLPNGISQKWADCGIDDRRSGASFGLNNNANNVRVNIADTSWMPCVGRTAIDRNIAPRRAKLLRIVSVRPLNAVEDVWCLTVPDGEMWSLVNGAITHNSHGADAYRYMSVRHKTPRDAKGRMPWYRDQVRGPMSWAG